MRYVLSHSLHVLESEQVLQLVGQLSQKPLATPKLPDTHVPYILVAPFCVKNRPEGQVRQSVEAVPLQVGGAGGIAVEAVGAPRLEGAGWAGGEAALLHGRIEPGSGCSVTCETVGLGEPVAGGALEVAGVAVEALGEHEARRAGGHALLILE